MDAIRDILSAGPVARTIAAAAMGLLIVGVMLVRRRRSSRPAGWIFLTLSAALHILLWTGLRSIPRDFGSIAAAWRGMTSAVRSSGRADGGELPTAPEFDVSASARPDPTQWSDPQWLDTRWLDGEALEPNADPSVSSAANPDIDAVATPTVPPSVVDRVVPDEWTAASPVAADDTPPESPRSAEVRTETSPTALTESHRRDSVSDLADLLGEDLLAEMDAAGADAAPASTQADPAVSTDENETGRSGMQRVPGADFAHRSGTAKRQALRRGGGNVATEAAVEAALQFLVRSQSPDGSWSPRASMAGVERSPLGVDRSRAGRRADTALTGLATLALLGAGHTHQTGRHSESVYRALVYLLRAQTPDGSLAGDASVYASTYAHGMATLAVAEAAAMTGDESAVDATRRAVAHTTSLQHPTTGGWRYTRGDPGDVSQLGWQAMALQAAAAADVQIPRSAIDGVGRFLASCRTGRGGYLSAYRPGERPSHTMTAESLAVRLLYGGRPSTDEINAASEYLLRRLPGDGEDNLYDWYYTTIALHQLGGPAWDRWNEALQRRLLSMQSADGSFPRDTVWGGYGGTFYTTAMATLCLEAYYRHAASDGDVVRNATLPP